MQQLVVNTLQEKGAKQDFSFISRQNAMFFFSELKEEQVTQLRVKSMQFMQLIQVESI